MSIEQRLNELIAAHFKVSASTIGPELDFYADLNADLLDLPELAMEIEDRLELTLDSRLVDDMRTVRELQIYVSDRVEQKRYLAASASVLAEYLLGMKNFRGAVRPVSAPQGDACE